MSRLLTTVSFVACFVVFCFAVHGDNLLVNGGFENNGYPALPCSSVWVIQPGTVNCLRSGSLFPPPGLPGGIGNLLILGAPTNRRSLVVMAFPV